MDLYVHEKQGENRKDPTWPPMARDLAELETSDPEAFAEVYRFRSKAEGTPSRIKGRNPYIRLRRRKGDPIPQFPPGVDGKQFSSLPLEIQSAIFDAATKEVGVARLNESLAILIVANLRTLNVMEHLYDQRVGFSKNHPVSINPPREIGESDLDGVA